MRITFLIPPCDYCGSAYVIEHPLNGRPRFVRHSRSMTWYGHWCSYCGTTSFPATCNIIAGKHMSPTLVPNRGSA